MDLEGTTVVQLLGIRIMVMVNCWLTVSSRGRYNWDIRRVCWGQKSRSWEARVLDGSLYVGVEVKEV